jgi:hypothetical protein
MHRIGLDVFGEVLADRAFVGIGRVRGAHDLAILGDGVFAFEHLNDDRAGRHEFAEIAEERAFLVNGIETFRLFTGQPDALLRNDAQSVLLETCIDLAREVASRRVRFNDREGPFYGHVSLLVCCG